MKIVIIGSGNVATQLGKAFRSCGHEIAFVYSRNINHAKKLGRVLKSGYGNNLREILSYNADVFMIAVKDDAIVDVVKRMPKVNDMLVFHTSGATDISVMKRKFRNCGVFWQIQTIRDRTRQDFKKVPVVIEASNSTAEKKLKQLATGISSNVHTLTSLQRRMLHLGAVFVNNFPNHLYYLAEKLLKKHHLDFKLYQPLILSTIESSMLNPKQSQTGPARRNDKKSMNAHLKLLQQPTYKSIYKLLSKSITETYNNA
jgi:predicted short-subunit dehydrogenase-like oxidoreductase (DUF2520 family)